MQNYKKFSARDVPLDIKMLLLSVNGAIKLIDSKGDYITISKKGDEKEIEVSKLDLSDFSGLSDKEILKSIEKDLGVNLSINPELDEYKRGIYKINELVDNAISSFYIGSRRDRILTKRGITINDIKFELPFKNHNEIISFLKSIADDRQKGALLKADLKCYMVKIVSVINNLLDNGLDKINEIEPQLFNYLSGILNIVSISGDFYKGRINGREFIFYGRPKSQASCIGKGLSDVKYDNLNKMKDGIGYTFEVNGNQADILFILKQTLKAIISLGGEELVINVSNSSKINLSNLDFKVQRSTKNSTNDKFEIVKITGKIPGMIGGIEIRITQKGNKNQEGLAFQGVYKILNTDIEGDLGRHFGSGIIDEENIAEEVDQFFINLEEELSRNPETKLKTLEEYKKGLWKDLKQGGFIIKINKIPIHKKALESQLKKGLANYYKSKLIKIGEGLYTTERAMSINNVWKKKKK